MHTQMTTVHIQTTTLILSLIYTLKYIYISYSVSVRYKDYQTYI